MAAVTCRRGRQSILCSVALTTVVATIATAPFALFHFNQIATYGLLANLAAVPLTAIWVMPLGVLTLLAPACRSGRA